MGKFRQHGKIMGMVSVSQRLQNIPVSPIRKLVPLANQAKERGVTVYHLNIGDPDIKTPDEMLQALHGFQKNPIGYANSQGEAEILSALRDYYRGLGFGFVENQNIQVTMGGSEALSMAMTAVAEVGEEILVFEPFYTNYNTFAAGVGVKLVPVATSIESGFHLPSKAEIETKITPKTKAILFTNPNNPTGTVYQPLEIKMLVEIASEHNLFLLADEVYREFVFDGGQPSSLLQYAPELPEQIIVLDSLSKRYSACGLRLGMIVSLNQDLMAGVLRMAMGRLSAGMIDQTVGAQLSRVPSTYVVSVKEEYQRRRDVVYGGLKQIPGVTIQKPEGAFYCVVGLPVPDADKFCSWLLTDYNDHNETVMLAPMAGFYATPGKGLNEVRLAYVLEVIKLKRAVELLTLALSRFTLHS